MEKTTSRSLTLEDEAEKVFNKFDTNADGKISSIELAAVLNGLSSVTTADEVDRIMSDLDTGSDGFIDLNEFKAFHFSDAGNNEQREAFNMYAKDKNGKIWETSARSRIVGE